MNSEQDNLKSPKITIKSKTNRKGSSNNKWQIGDDQLERLNITESLPVSLKNGYKLWPSTETKNGSGSMSNQVCLKSSVDEFEATIRITPAG